MLLSRLHMMYHVFPAIFGVGYHPIRPLRQLKVSLARSFCSDMNAAFETFPIFNRCCHLCTCSRKKKEQKVGSWLASYHVSR